MGNEREREREREKETMRREAEEECWNDLELVKLRFGAVFPSSLYAFPLFDGGIA